jgi:hypothetical protein
MTLYTLIFWAISTQTVFGHPTNVLQYRTIEYRSQAECLGAVITVKPLAFRCIRKEAI